VVVSLGEVVVVIIVDVVVEDVVVVDVIFGSVVVVVNEFFIGFLYRITPATVATENITKTPAINEDWPFIEYIL